MDFQMFSVGMIIRQILLKPIIAKRGSRHRDSCHSICLIKFGKHFERRGGDTFYFISSYSEAL